MSEQKWPERVRLAAFSDSDGGWVLEPIADEYDAPRLTRVYVSAESVRAVADQLRGLAREAETEVASQMGGTPRFSHFAGRWHALTEAADQLTSLYDQ